MTSKKIKGGIGLNAVIGVTGFGQCDARQPHLLDKLVFTADDSRQVDAMAEAQTMENLKADTLHAFANYIHRAETDMEKTWNGEQAFLWCENDATRAQQVRKGQIVAEFWTGRSPVKIVNGLIHDWVGAMLIPRTTVADVLALLQDYDNHKIIYKPDVMESAVISHRGHHFKVFLRLLKKKIITVVLDTDHDVRYRRLDDHRWLCLSHTTRVAEVENPGTSKELVLAPDAGHGFLWRLNSYWKFAQQKNDVYVECRAVSLTRDVPFGMGWMIEPIIQNLPREALVNTLEATRQGLRR